MGAMKWAWLSVWFCLSPVWAGPLEVPRELVQRLLQLEDLELRARAALHGLLAESSAKRLVFAGPHVIRHAFKGQPDAVTTKLVVKLLGSKDVTERRVGVMLARGNADERPAEWDQALMQLIVTDRSPAQAEALDAVVDIEKVRLTPITEKFAADVVGNAKAESRLREFSRRILELANPDMLARIELRDFLNAKKDAEESELKYPPAWLLAKLAADEKAPLKARLMELKSPEAVELLVKGFGADSDVKKNLVDRFDDIFAQAMKRDGAAAFQAAMKNDPALLALATYKAAALARDKGQIPFFRLGAALGPEFRKGFSAELAKVLLEKGGADKFKATEFESVIFWSSPITDPKVRDALLARIQKDAQGGDSQRLFHETMGEALGAGPDFLERLVQIYLAEADCSDSNSFPTPYTDSSRIPPCWYLPGATAVVTSIKQTLEKDEPARKRWQAAFAPGIEQALRFEQRLQPQVLLVQRPGAGALHAFDDELKFTARFVDREASTQLDQLAIGGREVEQARRAPEHGAAQQRIATFGVFQVEITVPAGRA